MTHYAAFKPNFFIAHLHIPPLIAGQRLHGGDFKGSFANDVDCGATLATVKPLFGLLLDAEPVVVFLATLSPALNMLGPA
ncbi:hypothetical protein ACFFLZ_05110 [Photobacterium aphoticum]|uniref:hypothetical protein n=1 Tax=Photobacterium aphoticum TaxID=754436 RepID=UPI0012E04948|nr:hypothetical protein [Photobacterium aphoticum]GHA32495.1 hypothetical protein GCM10007086_02040 [Photobacterium aphoticum]